LERDDNTLGNAKDNCGNYALELDLKIACAPLFLHRRRCSKRLKRKLINMHQKRKYRGAAWLVFFISAAALAFAIVSHWPWLTLIIPFVTTSFVLALDII
jgi:uncharacterized membrane protein YjjP (DUF1212 family)